MIENAIWSYPSALVISTYSPASIGATNLGAPVSTAWGTANRAVYVPFRIARPTLVDRLWVMAGATQGGANNVDLGIYDKDFTRVLSTGSQTYNGGTNVINTFNVTDTIIGPGQFYFAAVISSATDTVFSTTSTILAVLLRSFGCAQEASALPLPAVGTPAALASNLCPFMGLSGRLFV